MQKLLSCCLLLTAPLFYSCEGNQTPEPAKVENAKSFLEDVQSDAPAEFYFSGEFDGHEIYLASTFAHIYPYHGTSFNAVYLYGEPGQDNIHLIRRNEDQTVGLALYFINSNIFAREFPYNLPHANLAYCENAQLELINLKKIGTADQGSAKDDFSFWGYTGSSLTVRVNTFVDNVMEGTFEGRLTTKTGARITATNGKFRIRVVAVNIPVGAP
jgi:hypothetical protein